MICGDLGGTNGRLQLWEFTNNNETQKNDLILKFNYNYRIIEFSNLIELLEKFIVDAQITLQQVLKSSFQFVVINDTIIIVS